MGGVTSFGNASGDTVISAGTETWNNAEGYTKIKILRLIIELDLYETIAQFGYKDMDERERIDPRQIPNLRIEGLHRLIFVLRQLIGNCVFAIKDKTDKNQMKALLERVDNVQKYVDGCYDYKNNHVTKEEEVVINEQHFAKTCQIIRSIKDDLNNPINGAGLIFRASEALDLDEIMQQIIDGG